METIRTGSPGLPLAELRQQPAQAVAAPAPGVAATPAAAARASAPLRRAGAHLSENLSENLQSDVARAQQALDYLDRVAAQLETVKSELAAKLAGRRSGTRQLEQQVKKLGAVLDARRASAGNGVDNQLDFAAHSAVQRFRIKGLDLDAFAATESTQQLSFLVAGSKEPLAVTIEPGLSKQQIVQRLDRAFTPAGVRAAGDGHGQAVFSTAEANWPMVRDSLSLVGHGRVATEEQAPAISADELKLGDPDALRQSLREVVQTLARVRAAQEAASVALSRAADQPSQVDLDGEAQSFASAAGNTDYDSLLALASALAGVSRERVLALLGLR